MKNMMNVTLAMMAVSTAGCSTAASARSSAAADARGVAEFTEAKSASRGRVIEFESGAEGFNTKTFFYEGAREVVAFDAQFTTELAQKAVAHLREFTSKPITWLVITHPNPDKFNGASVFKALGARVASSEATAAAIPGVHAYKQYYFTEVAKMFKPGTYPQPIAVDQTFTESLSIVLAGGEKITLRELSQPGVSSTQTVAYIPTAGALIVGDLVHSKAHAWLEGGIVAGKPTPSVDGWIADLRELVTLYPDDSVVYGGRGLSGALGAVVPEQIAYLQTANAVVDQYISSLGAGARSELQGPNAQAHYAAIQKLLEQRFPDYALGCMIGYGVYGLVNSKL